MLAAGSWTSGFLKLNLSIKEFNKFYNLQFLCTALVIDVLDGCSLNNNINYKCLSKKTKLTV